MRQFFFSTAADTAPSLNSHWHDTSKDAVRNLTKEHLQPAPTETALQALSVLWATLNTEQHCSAAMRVELRTEAMKDRESRTTSHANAKKAEFNSKLVTTAPKCPIKTYRTSRIPELYSIQS